MFIKYLEMSKVVYTFAKPYTGNRGKGREKSKQINTIQHEKVYQDKFGNA